MDNNQNYKKTPHFISFKCNKPDMMITNYYRNPSIPKTHKNNLLFNKLIDNLLAKKIDFEQFL